MKILFLSQRFLYPMDTGGKIRTGKILEQLNKHFDITVISNVESSKDDKYVEKMNNLCSDFIAVPWKEVKRYTFKFFIKLFFQMFSRYPVNVLNDYSNDLKNKIKECVKKERYDLLICDFLQSGLNFKGINGYPCILFQHNVESMITKRHVESTKNLVVKIFWWLQLKKMIAFESKACKSFDTVIAVSEEDKRIFKGLYGLDNIETIPTGVDVKFFNPQEEYNLPSKNESSPPNCAKETLVFCGSMDWLPNEDAVIFFKNEILPHLKKAISGVKLLVVGRRPSPTLRKFVMDCPEIELTGWVDDIRPYISKSDLYIVPIRIGGGTRMKIFEAMAMGKTVISTSIGAEGLPIIDGKNIIIEDNPAKFGEKVVDLLRNGQERKEIGYAAHDFVHKYFTWEKVAEEFSKICRETLINNNLA